MSGCGTSACCPSGVGVVDSFAVSLLNVGEAAEWYRIGTGPDPFEIRTAYSSDGSVGVTQEALRIDLTVDAADLVSIDNIGLEAEWYVIGSGPDPFKLRTAYSSDGSVSITQEIEKVDFTVPAPALPPEAWQEDSTASISTSSSTFVTFTTLTGDAKVLDGEEWQINMGVLICCPYATAGSAVNAETKWLIETAAGVFTEFDRYSIDEHITIVGLEKSSPRFRMKKHTASMDAPRMRIDVRRSSAGATAFFWEDPRWGGNRIEPAP